MPANHTIQSGDCLSSVALQHGFFAPTIWNDGANAALKERRPDMNILQPGDVVVIPDKRLKEVAKPAKKRHRFRRRGVPAMLRLCLHESDGQPMANIPYRLDIDGRLSQGRTDGDGVLQQAIPPDARAGTLYLGEPGAEIEFKLQLGHLEPIGSLRGVKARLVNLGFPCGPLDGDEMDDATRAAILAFQRHIEHANPTGELDQQTRDELEKRHEQ